MESTPTDLPLSWHDDGTPIFERGDIIRNPRPLPPGNDDTAVMYDELMLPEHKHLRPELRFNLIVMQKSAGEFAKTIWLGKSYPDEKRGYQYPRVIQALDSSCQVILQRWDYKGKINDYVVLTMKPLLLAVVPPNYETVLVNVSTDIPARFVEIHAREEKRNTDILEELDGPGYKIKTEGGYEPNLNYDELPIPRIRPGLDGFKFMQRRPLYEMVTSFPKGFDFIDPPRPEFFAGAV